MRKTRMMFLCTGNSCRSQMAEGFARALGGDKVEAFSAGLEPAGVNPKAVQVMAELGVDISGQTSKPIDPKLLAAVDLIVTLCGDAEERCPVTPANIKRLHWPLPDPARAIGSEEEVLEKFRLTRNVIRRLIAEIIGEA